MNANGQRIKWLLATLLGVVIALAVTTAGFAIGAHTRKSGDEVKQIVNVATTETQTAAEAHEKKAVTKAVEKSRKQQKEYLVSKWNKKLKKAVADAREQAFDTGYSSGSSDGYSSGSTDGYSTGIHAGSDDLVCTDDPDVTWLPYCNW